MPSESSGKNLFWAFLGPYYPKNVILANFSHSARRILQMFLFETIFVFFYYNYLVKVLKTIFFYHFLTRFWPKKFHFDQKIYILANFSLSAHRILLLFHIEIIFMVFYYNYLIKVLRKNVFAHFLTHFYQKCPFWPQNCHFGQFLPICS